jgi:hypothetical protein
MNLFIVLVADKCGTFQSNVAFGQTGVAIFMVEFAINFFTSIFVVVVVSTD